MQDNSPIYIERLAPKRPTYKVAVVTETYPPDINGVAHTLSKTVSYTHLTLPTKRIV